MLSKAFPGLTPVYGLVASMLPQLTYSICNMITPTVSQKWNKKLMLAFGVIGFSMAHYLQSFTSSLFVFAGLRVMFGICASFINAPVYDTIARSFTKDFRTIANSIEHSGYNLGDGLASFGVIGVKNFGWRGMYRKVAYIGFALGALVLSFLKGDKYRLEEEEPKSYLESTVE